MEADPLLGYHHIPHANTVQYADGKYIPMRTNGLGLRQDDEIPAEKKPGEFRVFFSGDSYVLGWGVPVEKTFVQLLGNKIKRRFPNKDFRIMNGGHGAWGTEQSVAFIEDKVFNLQPDLIVVFFGANSIDTNTKVNDLYLEKEGSLVRNYHPKSILSSRSRIAQLFPVYDWLTYNSYLFQMAKPGARAASHFIASKIGLSRTSQDPAWPVHIKGGETSSTSLASSGALTLSPTEKKTLGMYNYLAEQCRAHGVNLLVLSSNGGSPLTTQFLNKGIAAFTSIGIKYHDLRDEWTKTSKGKDALLHLSDGHLNEQGNFLFSEAAWPFLERHLGSTFSSVAKQTFQVTAPQ